MTALSLSTIILAIAAAVLALYLHDAAQPQHALLRDKTRRAR